MTGLVAALVPAAGRGERLGGSTPKALRLIAGTPMLVHAVHSLLACTSIARVVVAAPADEIAAVRAALDPGITVVAGGPTRPASVRCALAALPDDFEIVLVHDAARPFVPAAVVDAVVAAVRGGHPVVVPVLPVSDTIKRVDGTGRVLETVSRHDLYAAQTPQGFRRDALVAVHATAPVDATDDAVLAERLGVPVWTVPGAPEAFKVTRPSDLLLAEAMMARRRG